MQVSFLREQFAIWFDMIVNLFDRARTGTKTRMPGAMVRETKTQ